MRRSALLFAALSLLVHAAAAFAGSGTLTVGATVLSKNVCRFRTANAALDFGAIDPGGAADVSAAASATFVCRGSSRDATFLITDDGGRNGTGPGAPRMRHATAAGEYLPYLLAYTPATATVPRNVDQTLSISGTVRAADFRNALSGSYADTVVLTIDP